MLLFVWTNLCVPLKYDQNSFSKYPDVWYDLSYISYKTNTMV